VSRSVGLLIDSSYDLEGVARQVASATSASVTATTDPAVWLLHFGEVEATLTANHEAFAGEALARRYRFAIAAHMAPDVTQVTSGEVHALREAAGQLRSIAGTRALLVLDGQNRQAGAWRPTEGEAPEPPDPGEVGA
jgi:hypothetical protein